MPDEKPGAKEGKKPAVKKPAVKKPAAAARSARRAKAAPSGSSKDTPKIGLCLSGGGMRAVAFHLGCLRAMHDLGILEKTSVLSTVSGGSIIGALWMAKDQTWDEFEKEVRQFLRGSLIKRSFKALFTTWEGPKSLACFVLIATLSVALLVVRTIASLMGKKPPMAPLLRFSSRTTIVAKVMCDWLYKHRRMNQMDPNKPMCIINATDLRTGTLFYFTTAGSGSGRYGRTLYDDFQVGEAVMASAAYPFQAPAIDKMLSFERKEGKGDKARLVRYQSRVVLSDGGVYDNLGLVPILPDRDPNLEIPIPEVDTIICCRAGYGQMQEPPTHFLMSRYKNAINTAHKHAQILQLKQLNDLKDMGKLKDVVIPFLGQDDSVLHEAPESVVPKKKLVPRSVIDNYPTDLSRMDENWIDNLSDRGEQLTRALIHKHAPHLVKKRALPKPS
ncbi:MAG: patatin-like phospholipase family protein [Rhodospirillales bacterium]